MNQKNKYRVINQIVQIIVFLSLLAIITIIALNFSVNGHLHGQFEIGFNIQSIQVYVFTTLIIIIIICAILSYILEKLDSKNKKFNH
ncbi:hypothetical protein [Staphylococcus saccharolyticus]|uniref:DUF3955 domain-containing protein n=1 Tax=Staphylococcus saccharolyticus TaxID=33028 RepID=A0A380HAZ8_9STAP|nr:hypothetical protein [Staphylococcus saccharolyticus]MBL7564400.1 hypothetical protein [Staphylococcus saccharolyticus]MBL7571336.1 hypothetical protein [Staphylococcus saccharolyticus]QQB99168.1 hypothetical protein I6I31_04740 [Staphylococcus saccharolyticus]QRJ66642.1 hypothetical protein DMB76_011115 [Staphylococcus saccharolyticus]RTX93069.1 hypothetical protein CD145_10550 [Staphylococcus saccharolyticus]